MLGTEYHMPGEYQTSPQWSQQRSFAHRVISKHGDLRNVTLKYFLFTPQVATRLGPSSTKLPLLCFLHGYRDHCKPDALGVFTDARHQQRLPLFVLRPGSTKTSNWAPSLRPSSSSHTSRLSPEHNVLLALLDRLLIELPVDPRLIVLSGASMGAYATWDLLVQAPTIFAVGIPMSGGGDTQLATRVTAAVWAFHSRADRTIPVNASREIVDAVALSRTAIRNTSSATRDGYEGPWTTEQPTKDTRLRYTELRDASHNLVGAPVFDERLAQPLFEWTLQQLQTAGFARVHAQLHSAETPAITTLAMRQPRARRTPAPGA